MNKFEEAIELFGNHVVSEVNTAVDMADADGAYALFEHLNMYDHAGCVEFLYFDEQRDQQFY
jgi:hypothetical protein